MADTKQTASQRWSKVLESKDSAAVQALSKTQVVAMLLDNQATFNSKHNSNPYSQVGVQESTDPINKTGGVAKWDPILIAMARRMAPQLIPFETMGVQPMKGPTGLIFSLKSHYGSQSGPEALHGEADTGFTGVGTQTGDSSGFNATGLDPNASVGSGMTTEQAETLGAEGGTIWGKMAFSILKSDVSAKTRAVYADYTHELREDMLNVHKEDADNIIVDILSIEMESAQNREFVRIINIAAKLVGDGSPSQTYNLANEGVIDVQNDTGGRMLTENWKGLLFWVEIMANQIAKDTRRGKGNFAFMTSNVASAFAAMGLMDYAPAMKKLEGTISVDETTSLFAGFLGNSRIKVFIDPYATVDYITVGYRGSALDAGIYWAPYVPVELRRATSEDGFQPRMSMKTRYGIVASPFVSHNPDGTIKPGKGLGPQENSYYRKVKVDNII